MHIYSYHRAPRATRFIGYNPRTHKFVTINDPGERRFFGIELEVEPRTRIEHLNRYEMAGRLDGILANCGINDPEAFFHLENDGSCLTGFEMVFMPMTLAALKHFPFQAIFDALADAGWKGDTSRNCGLHIHVSRASLGHTDKTRLKALARGFFLAERFYRSGELSRIARRDLTDPDNRRWARINCSEITAELKPRDWVAKAKALDEHMKSSHNNRYYAINTNPEKTVEFRIFRSTLKVERLFESLDFVARFWEMCTAKTIPEIIALTWAELSGRAA